MNIINCVFLTNQMEYKMLQHQKAIVKFIYREKLSMRSLPRNLCGKASRLKRRDIHVRGYSLLVNNIIY